MDNNDCDFTLILVAVIVILQYVQIGNMFQISLIFSAIITYFVKQNLSFRKYTRKKEESFEVLKNFWCNQKQQLYNI